MERVIANLLFQKIISKLLFICFGIYPAIKNLSLKSIQRECDRKNNYGN